MQAHPVRGDVAQGVVQRLDMQVRLAPVLVVGLSLEHHVPAQSQVRRIQLQQESGRDDGLVLGAHGIGQRVEVGLVIRVVLVRLKQRDNPRRRRIHERLGWPVAIDGRAKVCQVLLERSRVLHPDLSDALGPAIGGRAAAGGLALQETRKLLEVGRRLPRTVALESRDAVLDVGGVADLAHFAVADHVHAGLALFRHDRVHGVGQQRMPRLRLHPLALLLGEHHVRYGFRTGKAANVGGEDPVGGVEHDEVLCW